MNEAEMGYWGVLPGELLGDKRIPSAGKLLYVVLSSMAHSNGYCWPSNAMLAEKLDLSKRRVTELLSELNEGGYIRVEVIRSEETAQVEQRRIYCGIFTAGRADPSREISQDPPAKNSDTSREKQQDPPAKNTYSYKGRTYKENLEKEHTPIVPTEVIKRIGEYAGADAELRQSILDLLENRRVANKRPVKTLRAMSGILRDLDKLSGGHREMKLLLLEKAIKSNWLTVYPLKSDELPPASEIETEDLDGI